MLHQSHRVQELQTDDASTLSHAAFGLALGARDFETALSMIDRAIVSNPSSAHAFGHGTVINAWAGNYSKAVAFSEKALRLSPFDPLSVMPLAGQAGARLMMGDFEGAITYAKRGLQVFPTHSPSFLIQIAGLVRVGEIDRARAIACRMLEVSPTFRIIIKMPILEYFVEELRLAGLPG
jgi:tetratricopeptide (TPR) repeat protein